MILLDKKNRVLFLVAILMVAFLAKPTQAAKLYFRMDKTTLKTGDTNFVTLNLDTQGKDVNAVEAKISFDPSLIEVTKFVPDKCIINFWVQSPAIDNTKGTISFKGVILNPAFNGDLGRLIGFNFKAKVPGTMPFDVGAMTVLANDGKGTDLATLAVKRSVEITGSPIKDSTSVKISSTTHPNSKQWYNKKDVSIFWSIDKSVVALAYAFNKDSKFQVPTTAVTAFSSALQKNTVSGTWYAHIRPKDKKLGWLATSHFQINIDTEPPSSDVITVIPRLNDSFLPVIRAKAEDALSGVVAYEVWTNNKMIIKDEKINGVRLKNLVMGKNIVEVRAFDAVGNVRSDQISVAYNPLSLPDKTDVVINPEPTPAKTTPTVKNPVKPAPVTTKKKTTVKKPVKTTPVPVKKAPTVKAPVKTEPAAPTLVLPKNNYKILSD